MMRKRAGIDKGDCNEACGFSNNPGGMAARHYFSRSQWCLPTAEHYASMQRLFNRNGGDYLTRHYEDLRREYEDLRREYEDLRREYEDLRREYEDLRREYEDLRREYEDLRREYEDLRRPFKLSADVPYTDVWTFPTVNYKSGKHPCEKPLAMMQHIVNVSSRPGSVVLDCFAGSGVTGAACIHAGRTFIGIERERRYFDIAVKRIQQAIEDQRMPLLEAA